MSNLTKLEDLKSAVAKLKEGIAEAKDELDQDGVIQRFEFSFELTWKTIQEYARLSGLEVVSPKDAFRVAADLKLLDDPEKWFMFLKDRNETAHLYDGTRAKEIFSRIPEFIKEVESLISKF